MSRNTSKSTTANTPARLCALQAITHRRLKWSQRRLAQEIQCSPSMLLQMLDGRRQPSVEMLGQIENAERSVSYALMEADELDAMERDWLITAIERHAQEFTPKEKRRIEKGLRG